MKKETFRKSAELYQLEWKKKQPNLSKLPLGKVKVRGELNEYQHVLPVKAWELNLWPPLRTNGIYNGYDTDLPKYLAYNEIQKHTHARNLLSSWTLCANMYFPFGRIPEGKKLLSKFLANRLHIPSLTVTQVELEFQDTSFSPVDLLGEENGKRGSGQTSPDIGVVFSYGRGQKGLLLIENKYVEHSFYRCSANRRNGSSQHPINTNRDRCKQVEVLQKDTINQCHQISWGRKYWLQLKDAVEQKHMVNLRYCPAMTNGYQLFRQQALAEAFTRSGKYHLVYSAVAYDSKNEELTRCLETTGIPNALNDGWANLWNKGQAKFTTFEHREWVAFVRSNDQNGFWNNWLSYIEQRYGY